MKTYHDIFHDSHCLSKAQLMAYLKGSLDRDEVYTVETHLNSCVFCSEALDGLMEQPVHETEQALKALKLDFQERLKELEPVKPSLTVRKSSKNKWMIAASVIALLGLATLSVYSYLHHSDSSLAMDHPDKKDNKGDYQPLPDQTGEIKQITVDADDLKEAEKGEKSVELKSKATVSPLIEAAKKEENTRSAESSSEYDDVKQLDKESVTSKPSSKQVEETPPAAVDRANEPANAIKEDISTNTNYKQYETREKAKVPEAVVLSMKTKAGGMENKNYLNNSNSFPSNQNSPSNSYKYEQITPQLETEKLAITQEKLSDAIKYYNKKRYQKSISTLKTALQTANASQQNEIYYYLALCYAETDDQANAIANINRIPATDSHYALAQKLLQTFHSKK